MATLTYFTVSLYSFAVRVDYTDMGTDPDIQPITATVTFKPRIRIGNTLQAPDMTPDPALIILAPVQARLDEDGKLHTIQGDLGVKLVSNTPALGLNVPLIYDVWFTNVVYNKSRQAMDPFGFLAPVDATAVNLATVTRLPIATGFYPI